MTLELALEGGGRATLVETDGDRVTLLATRPFPPGSPLAGEGPLGTLRVKVRGCKRDGEAFRVDGRFVNLSREQRAALAGDRDAT
jgi:hypothetical protein